MDRRDALKKLGMGGATVVGATMVVSSPAFAEPGTETCSANSGFPTITAEPGGGNGANATVVITYVGIGTVDTCRCSDDAPEVINGPTFSFPSASLVTDNGNSTTWDNLPGSGGNFTVSLRVRCLDNSLRPVCSIVTANGTATRSGSIVTAAAPTESTTTVEYDSVTCPDP